MSILFSLGEETSKVADELKIKSAEWKREHSVESLYFQASMKLFNILEEEEAAFNQYGTMYAEVKI